jgi:hypothetical protein
MGSTNPFSYSEYRETVHTDVEIAYNASNRPDPSARLASGHMMQLSRGESIEDCDGDTDAEGDDNINKERHSAMIDNIKTERHSVKTENIENSYR